jgi:ferredoxin
LPVKFHIHTRAAPPRVSPVGKMGIVDWREDCSSCHNCVKEACVYGFYRDEADRLREDVGYLDYIYQCKGCLSCIQDCTKGLLTRVANPEYRRLGDDYFTPEIVLSTWFQADTGRIPVSGAGYGGRFSGDGFDSLWTDMSEIVRPTRDGIHGREYINTSVDIGRKNDHLVFENGELTGSPAPLVEAPMPVIFDVIPERWQRGPVMAAIGRAAAQLGLLSVIRSDRIPPELSVARDRIVPWLEAGDAVSDAAHEGAAMVMLSDGPDVVAAQAALKKRNEDQVVAIRLAASPDVAARVVQLAREGAEVVHLVADSFGREKAAANPRHMRDVLRDVHGALLEDGSRDQITLVGSGGIAAAEHMTKAVLCGADLVAIDVPLLLALECRLCGECERGQPCPVAMSEVEPAYAVQRITNLMGAWHLQLVEMLGAMGIREVRRLRGETGRCMFFEDLERETFGELFGKRREDSASA